jgi:phosphoglycerate dehydrogenase-like enzyme
MSHEAFQAVYGEEERARIESLTRVIAPPHTALSIRETPDVLASAEVLISGWGGPRLDSWWLRHSPNLQAVFYGAGSVAPLMTTEAWDRGIQVTSAYEANAVAVAEYTLAMVLLCLKDVWRAASEMRHGCAATARSVPAGCFERTVGLVSLGAVGRAVAARLSHFDLDRLAFDPFIAPSEAVRLGVTLVSLDEIFRQSDVVSLHAPHLAETERMITGAHLSSMKRGATFINTSRGALVCEDELIEVASRRSDLQVVLDVTEPTPPSPLSPLYTLPNVVLTPHLAGSRGHERRRMGRAMVDELQRYVEGEPLRWSISRDAARHSSHRPTVAST